MAIESSIVQIGMNGDGVVEPARLPPDAGLGAAGLAAARGRCPSASPT